MEIIYVIIGAVASIAGGIVAQYVQARITQIQVEKGVLYEVQKKLIELEQEFNELCDINEKIGGVSEDEIEFSNPAMPLHGKRIEIQIRKNSLQSEIMQLTLKIQSCKHRKLAILISGFVYYLDAKTEQDAFYDVIHATQKAVNRKFIHAHDKRLSKA